MVANKSSMYDRVPAFRTTLDSTLQLQLYTSLKQTRVAFYNCEKQQTPTTEMVNFISKPGVFFRDLQLNDFMNSYISCGLAPRHIIGASDFAITKVSFNQNKGRLSVVNLGSPRPVAGQTITVKIKCRIPFSEAIQGSVRGSLVHFKTKWQP